MRNIHPNGFDLVTNATFREWVENAWETDRSGPYSIAFNNIAGWLPLSAITPSLFESFAQELEAQDHASYLPEGTDPTVAAGYRIQMQQLAVAMRSRDTVFARFAVNATLGGTNPIMNQPLSRGTINIDARDPFGAPPLVDYRTLSNPLERRVLVEMVKWLRRYSFETSLGGLRPLDSAPGPDVVSDDQIAAWLDARSVLPSDYHPAGTAAMMPLALGGVVDQTLRVYGVRRLRVVDASIMPNLPGANTCQPVYAIAEKVCSFLFLFLYCFLSLLMVRSGRGHDQIQCLRTGIMLKEYTIWTLVPPLTGIICLKSRWLVPLTMHMRSALAVKGKYRRIESSSKLAWPNRSCRQLVASERDRSTIPNNPCRYCDGNLVRVFRFSCAGDV